jgi:nitroreductase
METLDCIKTRRSCRKYKERQVEFDKIAYILEAASKAPSSGNLQAYRFIVLTEREDIRPLPEMCMNQYWIAEAPLVIIVCGDAERVEMTYGLRGERLYIIQDCAAAIQNILLAAHDLGLGACWIGSFEETILADRFRVPEGVRVQALITIGYPAKPPEPKEEESIEALVYFKTFGNKTENMDVVMREFSKEISKLITHADERLERSTKGMKLNTKGFAGRLKEKIEAARKKKL